MYGTRLLKSHVLWSYMYVPITLTVEVAWAFPLLDLALHSYSKAYLWSMSVMTRSCPTFTALPISAERPCAVQ